MVHRPDKRRIQVGGELVQITHQVRQQQNVLCQMRQRGDLVVIGTEEEIDVFGIQGVQVNGFEGIFMAEASVVVEQAVLGIEGDGMPAQAFVQSGFKGWRGTRGVNFYRGSLSSQYRPMG